MTWLRSIAEIIGWLVILVVLIWSFDIGPRPYGFRVCYADIGLVIIDQNKVPHMAGRMREVGYRLWDIGHYSIGLSLPRCLNRLIGRCK